MANYFRTNYVVEGNKEDIDNFYEMMMKLKMLSGSWNLVISETLG